MKSASCYLFQNGRLCSESSATLEYTNGWLNYDKMIVRNVVNEKYHSSILKVYYTVCQLKTNHRIMLRDPRDHLAQI